MHPVDGDELLGQRERHTVVLGRRAGDAADHLAAAEPAEQLVQPLAGQPAPVGAHPHLVVGWAMTAGVHSTVWIFAISAALISRARWKISSSGQLRVAGAQPVADGVVLQGEQGLQHEQPDPESGHPPRVVRRVVGQRRQPVRVDAQLAVRAGPDELLVLGRRPVDLGHVPPVRAGVGVGRAAVLARRGGRVGPGAHDRIGRAGHGSSSASGISKGGRWGSSRG